MLNFSLSKIQDSTLKAFIVVCVILPTGSVFDINLKVLLLALLLVLSVFSRRGISAVKLFIGMFAPLSIILLFIIVTLLNAKYTPETLSQARDILVFFIMSMLAYAIVDKDRQYELITKLIVNCLIFLGVFKFLIFAYSVASGVSVSTVVKGISAFFNTSLMTMSNEDVVISRINFMSDYILPVAIYLKTKEFVSKKTGFIGSVIVLVLLYSIMISMSRFLWMMGLISFMIAILGNITKKKSIYIILIATIGSVYLLSLQSVQDVIEFRISSKGVTESDSIRDYQKLAISKAFENAPILGNGLGYFVPNLIRSETARYSYELQIQALYMQVGIIGASSLLLIIVITLLWQARVLSFREKLLFIILVSAWMSGGFFNPVIFSSTGGVAFLLLYTTPNAIRRLV
ncbi:hypothetical protein [Klebsiella pneumoniae]|uniref:hypothetical protein n=1 Tax=Klebsiella pneumoniae TaxID=573 RepID=UPI00192A9C8E|nr:hypothetical protein [Klebsiella pneumoniae]MBL4373336.1 hypothetical protein [Klebsiella pneumoniae]